MTEWQPIETAPRDGTEFLGWGVFRQEDQPQIQIVKRFGEKSLRENGWWVCAALPFYPRQWQPLPSPPKTEAAE